MANAPRTSEAPAQSVCPWWLIYFFDNPLRQLLQPAAPILQSLVNPGDACLDVGCGMGYFTIPMAELAGPAGRVAAVDIQPKMLAGVRRRAERHRLADRIELFAPDDDGWVMPETYDFILAFWMLHEVPDRPALLGRLRSVLKIGGRVLLAEPRLHVTERRWDRTLALARQAGFAERQAPPVTFSRAAILEQVRP